MTQPFSLGRAHCGSIPAPNGRGARFASTTWTVRAVRLEGPPRDRAADRPGI
jgi:hypothetical protein